MLANVVATLCVVAHEYLMLENEVGVAVLLPALFTVFRAERFFFAITDYVNVVRNHAGLYELVPIAIVQEHHFAA